MDVDLSELSASAVYHLMTQTIIPRPIAWVLTANEDASLNCAPFSYFNAVSSDPPLCMLSIGKKPDGQLKDTNHNLRDGAFCVVHIASSGQAIEVSATAATLDYGTSEVNSAGLALTKQAGWPLPRLSDCKVAFLGRVYHRQTIGNAPQQLIFVELLTLYCDDDIASTHNNRLSIDAKSLDPLARLGANQYADLGDVFTLKRPQ